MLVRKNNNKNRIINVLAVFFEFYAIDGNQYNCQYNKYPPAKVR